MGSLSNMSDDILERYIKLIRHSSYGYDFLRKENKDMYIQEEFDLEDYKDYKKIIFFDNFDDTIYICDIDLGLDRIITREEYSSLKIENRIFYIYLESGDILTYDMDEYNIHHTNCATIAVLPGNFTYKITTTKEFDL